MKIPRILIVDDQPEVRKDIRERLDSMQLTYDEAACQSEALEKLRSEAYDLVLLDLCIPRNYEGKASIYVGRTTLEQIVALPGPPVIVLTSHGGVLNAVEMMKLKAASFVEKDFEDGLLEKEIRLILAAPLSKASAVFKGGELIVGESAIELNGLEVAGSRGAITIRYVLECLAERKEDGSYKRFRGKQIVDLIQERWGISFTPEKIAAAVSDFRTSCVSKLDESGIELDREDVIGSSPYHIQDSIRVRIGDDNSLSPLESDSQAILRAFERAKKKLRKRQVQNAVDFSADRVEGALSHLVDSKRIVLEGEKGPLCCYRLP